MRSIHLSIKKVKGRLSRPQSNPREEREIAMRSKKGMARVLVFSLTAVTAIFIAVSFFVTVSWSQYYPSRTAETRQVVAIDVKPGECPNPLKVRGGGSVTVAILGAHNLDVAQIAENTIRLERARPTSSIVQDVAAPYKLHLWHVAPTEISENYCSAEGPDGKLDLVLTFNKSSLRKALGSAKTGDVRIVRLSAELKSGKRIVGEDVVVIRR
jgi:hypothetical protein